MFFTRSKAGLQTVHTANITSIEATRKSATNGREYNATCSLQITLQRVKPRKWVATLNFYRNGKLWVTCQPCAGNYATKAALISAVKQLNLAYGYTHYF